jgi:hypothetical protein
VDAGWLSLGCPRQPVGGGDLGRAHLELGVVAAGVAGFGQPRVDHGVDVGIGDEDDLAGVETFGGALERAAALAGGVERAADKPAGPVLQAGQRPGRVPDDQLGLVLERGDAAAAAGRWAWGSSQVSGRRAGLGRPSGSAR